MRAVRATVRPFVVPALRQRHQPGLGHAIGAPERRRVGAVAVADEHHRGGRRRLQQRIAGAGQQGRGDQVDAQKRVPGVEVLLRHRHQGAELRGSVDDAVEPAELVADALGDALEAGLISAREIERHDRRLRAAGFDDGVISRLERVRLAAEQHGGRAGCGE